MARQTAYQFIEASYVIQNVRHGRQKVLPANERQARPLTKLDTPELQQQAWEKIAGRMGISQQHVSRVLDEFTRTSKMNIATGKGKKSKGLKKTKAKIREEKIEHVEQTLEKELGRKPAVRKSEAVH
jgi:hypothetical protein